MKRLSVLVAILLAATPAIATEDRLIEFEIEDQFKEKHTDAEIAGATVIVVGGDRKGSDFMENWVPVLTDTLAADEPDSPVRVVSLAHVKGVPFFIKGKVRGKFSKDPAEWVLLDWGGKFNKAYGFTEDHANILVFAPNRSLVHRATVTEFDPVVLGEILTYVAAIRRGDPAAAEVQVAAEAN